MLALGMFVFMRQTLPHQTMQRESDYRWPSNSRIGKRDAFQFLGVGEENITLAGVLYPEPVSYTHLDVYKRQHIFRDYKLFLSAGDERGLHSS